MNTEEKANFIRSIEKAKAASKERALKAMKDIPEIHWEILSYSNTHTKQEVIEKYPEHLEFINKIVGFN